MLPASWTVVARRAFSDRLMLTAAMASILLATTLLAASPIFADSVTLSSLHRILQDGESDASLEIRARAAPERFEEYDGLVRRQVDDALAATGAEVALMVSAGAFELPFGSEDELIPLAALRHMEGIEANALLIEGAWPDGDDGHHGVAVFGPTADALELTVGDTIPLTSRHDSSVSEMIVTGIFEIPNPNDLFWHNDPLVETGAEASTTFRTHGPFIADRETVFGEFTAGGADMRWRVFPDHQAMTVSGIPDQRRAVGSLEGRLNQALGEGVTTFTVETDLTLILAEAEQSVAATRSSVLMLSVQLGLLAGYSLIHTAGLLVDSRAVETGLLRARGAGNGQVFTLSAMEGTMLTLPAILLAPTLASLLLRFFSSVGPLASIGLTLDPQPSTTAYGLSLLAGLVAIAALSIPAYRSSRTFNDSLVARSRQETRSLAQRAGWDVALLTLAAVGFWQLSTHGVALSSSVRDRWGLDPLLIAVPALGLVSGAVLALRFVPLAAAIIEKLTGSGKATVSALSAWQIARRPQRYSRSALLLIIAVSIGVFVSAYSQTWTRSQHDQAAFQSGADLRVVPGRVSGSDVGMQLRQAHEDLEGVTHSMPVAFASGQPIRGGPVVRFIALDAAVASGTMATQEEIATDLADMMARLVDARPALAAIPLPGEPQWVFLEVELTSPEPCGAPFDVEEYFGGDLPPDFELDGDSLVVNDDCLEPLASLVVNDQHGLLHRLAAGRVEVNEGMTTLAIPLAEEMSDGTALSPSYPLSLVAIEFSTRTPSGFAWDQEGEGTLSISVSQHADGRDPMVVDLGDVELATEMAMSGSWFDVRVEPSLVVHSHKADFGIAFTINTGAVAFAENHAVHFALRPEGGGEAAAPVPLLVTSTFLEDTGTRVGDMVTLDTFRIVDGTGVVVGGMDLFPTIAPGTQEAVVMDLATVQAVSYLPGSRLQTPSEHWLSVDESRTESIAEELRQPPISSMRVVDRFERTLALLADPLALSTIAALSLGFVAALVFAVIAFTLNIVVLARERRTEFTLLRALGLSIRQLRSWLILEQGALLTAGLLLGTGIGVLLSWVVLPLISVTQGGEPAVPEPSVVYPISEILGLELAVIAIVALVVVVLVSLARRHDLASQLRMGDD